MPVKKYHICTCANDIATCVKKIKMPVKIKKKCPEESKTGVKSVREEKKLPVIKLEKWLSRELLLLTGKEKKTLSPPE